jgi:predicted PurR-regulated permease PerM
LIAATFWIVRPFLSAFLWATMIVISTWPFMLKLQARLWGRRGLATATITVVLLLILIVPLSFSVVTLVDNMDRIVAWVQSFHQMAIPPLPEWARSLPLVGPKLSVAWQKASTEGLAPLASRLQPYAGRFLQWFTGQIGGVGTMILQFLLTIIISAILYTNGELAARGFRRFAHRLGGPSGEKVAVLAGNSVRGVAMGVVLTATVQAALAGLGLVIAAIPGAWLLTAVVFILCLAQLGPLLAMLPVVVWKYSSGDAVWGTVLLIVALVAGTIDNFLRPVLIRKGADLPLLLIFCGVIGGLMALGIIGVFVGPVILAVTYTLLKEWVEDATAPAADAARSTAR